jgi:hypothetical protein
MCACTVLLVLTLVAVSAHGVRTWLRGWYGASGEEVATVLAARTVMLHTRRQHRCQHGARLVLPTGATMLAMATSHWIAALSLHPCKLFGLMIPLYT